MNNTTESLQAQKVQEIAQELEESGYAVSFPSSASSLPFDLDGYIPDLIASKNAGGIVLEVKSRLRNISIDRLQDIADRIAAHRGWQFKLVTFEDIHEKILPSLENALPTWKELQARLPKLDRLHQEALWEPALLFAWSILEGALRKRAIDQNLPIDRFPPVQLLSHSFSSGEISIGEFDIFRNCLDLRDRAAHGIFRPISADTVKEINTAVQTLVNKWSKDSA
jgi:REase_AHJR-like